MQTESTTDRLNVPTNVLDVPTDLVKTKSGEQLPPAPFGYVNAKNHVSFDSSFGDFYLEHKLSIVRIRFDSRDLHGFPPKSLRNFDDTSHILGRRRNQKMIEKCDRKISKISQYTTVLN